MEKLISLLNEYETPQSWVVFKSYDNYDGTFYGVDCDGKMEIAWSDSLITSKKFWFIKWLVENKESYFEEADYNWHHFDWKNYEDLIMLLSVIDNPIEFLSTLFH